MSGDDTAALAAAAAAVAAVSTSSGDAFEPEPVVIYMSAGRPPLIRTTDSFFTLGDALRILNMRQHPQNHFVGLQNLGTNEVVLGAGRTLFPGSYKTLRLQDVYRMAASA
jgi:hypothetical protein